MFCRSNWYLVSNLTFSTLLPWSHFLITRQFIVIIFIDTSEWLFFTEMQLTMGDYPKQAQTSGATVSGLLKIKWFADDRVKSLTIQVEEWSDWPNICLYQGIGQSNNLLKCCLDLPLSFIFWFTIYYLSAFQTCYFMQSLLTALSLDTSVISSLRIRAWVELNKF